MFKHKERWSVRNMCKVLTVSETGYYKYARNKDKPSKDEILLAEMIKIRQESKLNERYGYPRMQIALAQKGIKVGLRRVWRIMKEQGWTHKKRRCRCLTKADPKAQFEENLLKQNFEADTPLTKLLTDITQTPCKDGTLYISPIMDCFNKEIVALEMDNNMKAELCVKSLKNLTERYHVRGTILHSDRGSQYTSHAFRCAMSKAGVVQSLSSTGHCYDNAPMESFFATLKKELLYQIPTTRMTMEEVKKEVFRYIFTYYNRIRVHTSNPEGLAPTACRKLWEKSAKAA